MSKLRQYALRTVSRTVRNHNQLKLFFGIVESQHIQKLLAQYFPFISHHHHDGNQRNALRTKHRGGMPVGTQPEPKGISQVGIKHRAYSAPEYPLHRAPRPRSTILMV